LSKISIRLFDIVENVEYQGFSRFYVKTLWIRTVSAVDISRERKKCGSIAGRVRSDGPNAYPDSGFIEAGRAGSTKDGTNTGTYLPIEM
jgi:hypothetical protein